MSIDALLADAQGPTGPSGPVDLGDPLLADLSAMLTRCNGFTAFSGGLRVYRSGGAGDDGSGPELAAWNGSGTWKDAFLWLLDRYFVFGRDAGGRQYCVDLDDGSINLFHPDDGSMEWAARSLEEWADGFYRPPFHRSTEQRVKIFDVSDAGMREWLRERGSELQAGDGCPFKCPCAGFDDEETEHAETGPAADDAAADGEET